LIAQIAILKRLSEGVPLTGEGNTGIISKLFERPLDVKASKMKYKRE